MGTKCNSEVVGTQCATLQKEGVDPRAVLEQVDTMCSEVRNRLNLLEKKIHMHFRTIIKF